MFIAELFVNRRLKSKKSELDEQPVTTVPTSTAVPKTTVSVSPTRTPIAATPVPRVVATDTGRLAKGATIGVATSTVRG
jgi:hypothetical protein